MKPGIYLFTLLFIGTIFTSCKKSDISYESDFQKSYKAWLSFKESSGNSYSYKVPGGSILSTSSWPTIITVSDGKVTKRHYKFTPGEGLATNIPEDELEWTENENEINSHVNGAPALTLDEIYEKARNNWLKKRSNAKSYFEAKNNGLISSCGYIEDGCQDDCFIGITITFIKAL